MHLLKMVLGKMPPGKVPPGKLPPGNKPPRKIATPENCPPPPKKSIPVKLLHVMEEYLSGENFVNFNFRQS